MSDYAQMMERVRELEPAMTALVDENTALKAENAELKETIAHLEEVRAELAPPPAPSPLLAQPPQPMGLGTSPPPADNAGYWNPAQDPHDLGPVDAVGPAHTEASEQH